mgnify:CR=1 FL=1
MVVFITTIAANQGGTGSLLVLFFIPFLYHGIEFFRFFVQVWIDDRSPAAFRFHHDGPDALILSEREREGARGFSEASFKALMEGSSSSSAQRNLPEGSLIEK